MSKILEKNSVKTAGGLFKRSVEWVTGWWHKYRADFLFRSECNAILAHIFFFLILLLLFAVVLHAMQESTVQTITQNIQQLIANDIDGQADSVSLGSQLDIVQTDIFIRFTIFMGVISLLFGYIISRITLYPARHVLEAQKRFVRNIAHELRTPLSIIRMNSDLDLIDETLPDSARRSLVSNVEELDRISGIINNLLTLDSFLQKETIVMENVDLNDVVAKSLKELQGLIANRDVSVTHNAGSSPIVWGSSSALGQVATNVIKNAILYSKENDGTVTITTQLQDNGYVALIVQDDGIGIEMNDLERIFEPFYRADISRKRNGGGSGIGLTIVSEIVKLHKGKVAVQSYPSTGTTVSIFIPWGKNFNPIVNKDSERKLNEISVDYSHSLNF